MPSGAEGGTPGPVKVKFADPGKEGALFPQLQGNVSARGRVERSEELTWTANLDTYLLEYQGLLQNALKQQRFFHLLGKNSIKTM